MASRQAEQDDDKDPSNFLTNKSVLEFAGSIYEKTPKGIFATVFRMYFLMFGCIQYAASIVMLKEDEGILRVVECIHWVIVFIAVNIMAHNSFWRTKDFLRMEATIKSGFYDYNGRLTDKQIKIRADTDKIIRFLTFWTKVIFAGSLFLTYFRAPLFLRGFKLPYPFWFPWEINTWPRYLATMAYIWCAAETLVTTSAANCIIFFTFGGHLDAEIRVLIRAIGSLDDSQDMKPAEREAWMKQRIKECVHHQHIIIDFFSELQRYFNWPLFILAFSMGLLLCTLGYIVISPETTTSQIASFLAILVPELSVTALYCILGQRIADMSAQVRESVYNVEWYTQPVSVQKHLLLLMIGSSKYYRFTGFGLHEFSHKGLSEILQASFTYFNMLNAISGGV